MEKDFQNRKVKFYILERRNVKVPKLDMFKEKEYDDFDLSIQLWKNLSNKACDDCGFLDRKNPKIPYSYNDLAIEKIEYKKKRLEDVKSNIKKIYVNKSVNSINIAKGSEMYDYHKNPYKSSEANQNRKYHDDQSKDDDDMIIKFKVTDDRPSSITSKKAIASKNQNNNRNQVIKKK